MQWPFQDKQNVAVITTRKVVDGEAPITYASHDEDDGGWQFHDGGSLSEDDAMVVSLRSIFDRDPSIAAIADLPLGWCASRKSAAEAWSRRKA
jgi:hypothetical protein